MSTFLVTGLTVIIELAISYVEVAVTIVLPPAHGEMTSLSWPGWLG